MTKYGKAPVNLGRVEINVPEVMYYLYLPVKFAGGLFPVFPLNLLPLRDLLQKIQNDLGYSEWRENYIYITIKRMYVGGSVSPNRPGWHTDGFGSDDTNYIWYDELPTEFSIGEFNITDDHHISLREFIDQAPDNELVTYPNKTLLKLDPYVVHRVAPAPEQLMRTFIKISVSKNKYNLKDNSINHDLEYNWVMHDREKVRNDPCAAQGDSYEPDQH